MAAERSVRPQRQPIDARRQLTPRDYLVNPDHFGEHRDTEFRCPDLGDAVSLEIARTLHVYVCAWRRADRRCSGASIARRLGFSRQTWSHVTRGRRWPACTVLVALLITLRESADLQPRRTPSATVAQPRSTARITSG